MGSHSQDNYHAQASAHKSSSCICCSCSEEDKELVATQSNSAIRCRCWESNSPPQPPEAWRETFDQLVRQWGNQSQNRGSEDHIRPYFPTPGDVRIMFGKSDINNIPEYATEYNMRDPQEWRPDAYQAPSINQQVEEWARWERATLRVSVKSFDPVTGSHFSLGSTWNPGTVPVVNSSTRNTPTQFKSEADELDTKRAHVESLLRQSSLSTNEKQEVISAFLKNTMVISGNRVEVSIAMLRRSTANYDEKKRTLFSALKENADKLDKKRGVAKAVIDALIPDINTQSAMFVNIFRKTRNGDSESESDYYNQVMNDVTMLTEGRDMTNDETRVDVESLVRTSQLNAREKEKVIDTLLNNNNLDPNLRKSYAESMIRRCAMSNDERRANIISILQDADITPSSKAEVIAMILEEDSQTGSVFDNSYNTDARDIDNIINESLSGTSLGSKWDEQSKISVKPSRSLMGINQTSGMENLNESSTTQGQKSGELYSYANINQPSKYSNLQGQSASQMYGLERDSRRDISKTTANVESVRSTRHQVSKASFKPSRSHMDRSQMSAMDNTSIPPHLLESYTSHGQNYGGHDSSKYNLQGQSPYQMYGSQRSLGGDVSRTTTNVESVRNARDQASKSSFKKSRSQMDRSQTSPMDNMSNIYESQRDLRGDISKASRNVESVRSMKDPSKTGFKPSHSHMDRSQTSAMDNTSIMYGSQRDIKGDISKTIDNVESVRSIRDPSKASFKPSHSKMDRSQMSAMESNLSVQGQSASKLSKKNIRDDISKTTLAEIMESVRSIKDQTSKASVKPSHSQMERSQRSAMDHSPHHLESSTSQGHKSRELYSTANLNQSSKHSNIKSQGQSPSEMYDSKWDIRGDVSKTKYNGNVESLRTIKEHDSKCSVKPSRSQIENSPSIISHHLPLDDMRSSISLDSDEKLVDLEDQEHSLPKKSILCTKCNYLKTCGCVKLCNN